VTNLEIQVPCPKCHQTFAVSMADIHEGASRTCPHCGAAMRFKGADGGKIQKAIDDLGKAATNVTTNVKVTIKD
jgi:endogenous inhibitor of DNA gyrase (YacG/DUF329 family)